MGRNCPVRLVLASWIVNLSWPRAVAALALIGCVVGCASSATRPAARPPSRDPRTVAALLKIATVFNDDYDSGSYGPVYDRWDARSKAIISRAQYILRHTECPTSPTSARVQSAHPGPDGEWLVSYIADGVQLTDYWFYDNGRWEFDLPLSNPSSVALYKLPSKQYVAQLGCAH